MARYKYTALTLDGKRVKGVEESDTAIGVRTVLAARELRLVELKEKKSFLAFELTKRKVPRDELMHFSRQLAAFARAGIPLLDALEVIGEESGNELLHQVLREVREALRSGETLSDAVAAHAEVFPPFYVDMLRAAELTGRLDEVLDQLSRYIERDLEARRKIRSALTYPAVIFVMSVVTIVVLTAFVLPRFRRLFESLDARLPLPTRILLGLSDFLANWYWALAAAALVLGLAVHRLAKTPRGRLARDRLLLGLPVIGDVVKYAIIERFCRIVSSMARAGVPLPKAMQIAGDATNNVLYQRGLLAVQEAVLEGEGLSRPAARSGLFPPSVVQMMRVGEDTGTLDDQLASAAQFYDQELDYKIKRLTTLFEPAVIVGMGLLVGFVAVALVSAMYGIFTRAGRLGA